MNAAVTQQFSSDLETFFDDNACSYELCTGILYQGCQSFQRFSVCQEIIDQENFVSFSIRDNKTPVSGNSRGLVYVSRFCISSGSGAWKFKGSPVIGWTKESDAE